MFNTLRNNVYFYLYYDHVKTYYSSIHTCPEKEEIYYNHNTNKLFLAIKDNEIGKRLYDVLKTIHERGKTISCQNFILRLDTFSYDKNNIVKYICFTFYPMEVWKSLRDHANLINLVSFAENLKKIGLYLDGEKLKNIKLDSLSEFLSCFLKVDNEQDIPKDCIIKYIHKSLTNGGDMDEFYKSLTDNKIICEKNEFPYSMLIVRMCYNNYRNGYVPKSISDVLNRERFNFRADEFIDALIALNNDFMSKYFVTYENDEYIVYDDCIKIYNEKSPKYKEFLKDKDFIIDSNEKLIEQIDRLIVDLDGNVIGYTFHLCDLKDVPHKLLDKNFNSQIEIVDFVLGILKSPAKYIIEDENLQEDDNFDIENSIVYLEKPETSSSQDLFKFKTFEDEFKFILYRSNYKGKKQITILFFKLLLKFLNSKEDLVTEKQFFEKNEVRYLNPIVAREFVNFALGEAVNYNAAVSEFMEFLEHKHEATNIYYDARFEYNPDLKPFLFNYEVKEQYNIKLEKNTSFELKDGRKLVMFKRSKHAYETAIRLQNNIKEIRKSFRNSNFGNEDDDFIKFIGISKLVLSKELNSNNMYKVMGYITEPIQGERLTMEYLLGLNNRDLFKIVGRLFSNFGSYKMIPWEYIFVEKDFVININICEKDFNVIETDFDFAKDYIKDIFSKLTSKGYNPNAFVGLKFDEKYTSSDVKLYFCWLSGKLDTYCDKHKIYYDSDEGQCQLCAKTRFILRENLTQEKLTFEDEFASHYLVDNGNYGLKVYKRKLDNIIQKNVDRVIGYQLLGEPMTHDNLGQDLFIPLKKAFDKNGKFIGYVYKPVDFENNTQKTDICIDIGSLTGLKNLPRLKSLIRLLYQVKNLTLEGYGFIENPFTHVFLNASHKKQVQILNIDLLSNVNVDDTRRWTCEYVCKILDSDETIEFDTSGYLNQYNYMALLSDLESMAEHLTGYCTVHNMYYMDKFAFCPKCIDKNILMNILSVKIDREKFRLEDIDNEGGAAYIYSYGAYKVVKIFKEEAMINYNLMATTIFKILSKKQSLMDINKRNKKFKYIYPEIIAIDSKTNRIIGYTMEKVVNGQPISNLRDKNIIEKLGFTIKDIMEILITIGEGIEALHKETNIFIGDLNGRNILFDKNKKVYFLDFDGMGVDEIQPDFCTDGYIDPVSKRNQNITAKDDWYSFAIQAFYYLTYTHPFNGIYYKTDKGRKVVMDVTERMENRISLLGNHCIDIPAVAIEWNWMSEELEKAFLDIFEGDSRVSIVPFLKNQYESFQTLFSKELQPLASIIRVNPKFIAIEMRNYFSGNVFKVFSKDAALCIDEDNKSFYVVILRKEGENIKHINITTGFPNPENIRDIVLSENKLYFFAVYDNGVCAYSIDSNRYWEMYEGEGNKILIVDNTVYSIVTTSNRDYYISWYSFEENVDVEESVISLGKHNFKWFNVINGTKFILVKRTNDGLDRVYCNSEKFCDIPYIHVDSEYNIIYDKLMRNWLVINSDGNGVIIEPDGKYKSINISQFVNLENIDNIEFRKGKVYIPSLNCLYIVNVNDQTTKSMECHKIMSPYSKLFDINAEGFCVISKENVLYEVRRG